MVENVFAAGLQATIALSFAVAVVEACPDLRCLQLVMVWNAGAQKHECTFWLDQLQTATISKDKRRRRGIAQSPEHFSNVHAGTW